MLYIAGVCVYGCFSGNGGGHAPGAAQQLHSALHSLHFTKLEWRSEPTCQCESLRFLYEFLSLGTAATLWGNDCA